LCKHITLTMKRIFFIFLTIISFTTYGQDKYNYAQFNKLTAVAGTPYVIASIENSGKVLEAKSRYLLFINTTTGDTKQVDFPNDAEIGKIEQIKIDSLNLNLILVSAKTIDLDGKSGIDWNDPTQLIILSADGKTKTQLTANNFFARTWTVNRFTGTLVVTGNQDTNNNNKYDKEDKSELHIYNLKTLKLINKI